MPIVHAPEGESFENALRRFKRKVEKAGILTELRKREHLEKPAVKRKAVQARKKVLRKLMAKRPVAEPAGRRIHHVGGLRHSYVLLLGLDQLDTASVLRSVEAGLAFTAFEHLQRNLGLSQQQVSSLIQIAGRTLSRRREEGRFRSDESDRLLRASRVLARALELFEGDADAARGWLTSPQPAVGGAVPLALAESDVGAREVEAAIGRIEHGVYA